MKDACARYGAHIVAIPRDNLLVLSDEDGNPLYNPDSEWDAVTPLRKHDGAKTAILALGATAGIAQDAAEQDEHLSFHSRMEANGWGLYYQGLAPTEDAT